MTRWPRGTAEPRPRRPRSRRTARSGQTKGFTLVELLIVLTITPVIVGALSLGLITIFSLQHGISSRVADAGDAQVVSATFLKDVESAAMITEKPSLACGSAMTYTSTPTQLLGLEWGGRWDASTSTWTFVNAVSYITEQNAGLSSYSLIRQFCSGGLTGTAAQVNTVATDLTASGAATLPTIQCASNPVDANCSPSFYQNNWMSAGDVQFVLLSAPEHALLPAPNSTTPFRLTLSASPRLHLEVTNPSSGGGSAPLTVLGTSCSTPSLEITNNVTVSINVSGGVGNGTLGLNAKNCPTVQVDNGGALRAGSVLTTNPDLNSVFSYPSGATYPVPEFYAPQIIDPYAGLVAPSTSETGLNPGNCTPAGSVWTCSAGYYRQDPGTEWFGNGAGQTINFQTTNCTPGPDGCRFLFEQGLSLPGQANINFATGVYVYEGGTSGVAITANPGVSINGAITGGTQLLFYIANGSASFAPGITINMAGLNDYLGVTIWDADTSNPLIIGNNSGGGAFAGYGGIYVPSEGVEVKNDVGTLTVSFLVANWLTFKQNLTIDITTP